MKIKEVILENKERPYVCVHAKKGKCEVTANSSYEAAKKAADKWKLKSTAGIDAYLADVEHTPVNESDEGSETKYGVFSKGGSIGSKNDKPMKVFDNAEDAKAYASRQRKQLTPGEKGYYKMGFVVKKINEAYDPFAIDGEEDDYDAPQSNVQNIIAQLEKAQDFDGNKVINFENGDQKKLPLKAIEIFLAAYGSVKDKQQMSADAASSIDGFVAAVKDSVSGKYGKAQKSTYDGMAGSRTGGMTYYN